MYALCPTRSSTDQGTNPGIEAPTEAPVQALMAASKKLLAGYIEECELSNMPTTAFGFHEVMQAFQPIGELPTPAPLLRILCT